MLERQQSPEEEIASAVSAGLGLVVAVIGALFLIVPAVERGSAHFIVGVSAFAATMVILYLASTIYHALPLNRAKEVFLAYDHAAIFLFIAGTYTPFTLGVLRGTWGGTLFGLVWGPAITGTAFKIIGGGRRYPRLSIGAYLGMGWLVVIAAVPLWGRMPLAGLLWVLAGGVAYTVGVPFLTATRIRYSHFV
jgi:hemolysin III